MRLRSPELEILLIDDDEDELVQIRDLLSEIPDMKYQIRWASSYEEGLATLRSTSFQACLLDYRLGAKTGLELLREVQNNPARCPIILLTGHGDVEVDIEAMRVGAADFLVKGELTPQLLGRSLRYAIKQAADLSILQEQTENFKTLFNSTFEGIIVHQDGLVVDANSASGEIFGCDPTFMVGTELNRYFQLNDTDLLRKSLSPDNQQGLQLTGLRHQTVEFPVEIFTRAVSLQGQRRLLTKVHDLTIRRELETKIIQQDRLASLGLLASSLAHEIGTPMAVIRGRAEMLLRRSSGADTNDLDLIISQIDRITKLMQSVLQLARGKQTESITGVNLVAVLSDMLELLSQEFNNKKIRVDMSIQGEPVVQAEAGPLGQVLLNLLLNSIQAIEEEKRNGRTKDHCVEISALENKQGNLELCIQDTGCGISEENLSQLFKPFFTTKPIGEGTGLGLAITYKIIQSWGGSISVESQIGQGTAFCVMLRK